MDSSKKGKTSNPKKGKSLIKLINKSDSDTEDSEHELSYYLNDRVKLMKEVIKILKSKKIRSMAPKWMNGLDINEINSMLFEELLGISNKRLKCIFNGQKQEEDSSSTDPENEQQKPDDIISLDDVTDDEFIINLDSDDECRSKQKKSNKVRIKEECKRKKIKREKYDTSTTQSKADKEKNNEENLMSVLELLELQARARAIRSQLALENKKKAELKEKARKDGTRGEKSDNEDAVIIESPKHIEIIITSSDSENEESNSRSGNNWGEGSSRQKNKPSSKRSITGHEQVSDKSKGEFEERSNNEERGDIGIMDDYPGNDTSSKNTSEKENLSLRDIPSTSKQIIVAYSEPEISKISRKRHLPEESDQSEPNSKVKEVDTGSPGTSLRAIENNTDPSELVSGTIDENEGIIINVDQSEIECITSD